MSNIATVASPLATTPSASPASGQSPKSAPKPASKTARKTAATPIPDVKPTALQAATAKPDFKPNARPKAVSSVPSKAVVAKATAARKVVAKKTPVAKPAVPKVAVQVAATPLTKPAKIAKKPKMVRDSFTIPKAEYTVLDELKQRAAKLTQGVKKSELLRAGIKALAAMSDAAFLSALEQVPAIKTGRPAAGK